MNSPINWHNQAKKDGGKCLVPVRQLDGKAAKGWIGQTQVTKNGVCPPRVKFNRGHLKRLPTDYLFKMSVLKRSMAGACLVTQMKSQDDINARHRSLQYNRSTLRGQFYSKAKRCANRDIDLWGGDIIIGPNHKHRSFADQGDGRERNGNYKAQRPIPDAFMLDAMGNRIPWEAGPLSDSRSFGRWKIKFDRFYVGDGADTDAGKVSDKVTLHQVGHYYFKF